ncbi:MAG TPA: hypothetical protein VFD59_15280 [Nocardioidaceae bacterium]|nr:hypothetical protein [Nocardioidaceae bacterium]
MNVSSRLAAVGLVALAAVNVFLVAAALRSTHATATDSGSVSSAATSAAASGGDSAGSSSTPTVSPSATPTGTTTAGETPAVPLQVMLEALDDQHAWRVGAGSCADGGATLATTSDGGKTWVDIKAPLRAIVRVRPADARSAFVVGAGPRCLAELKSTTNGGGVWGSTSTVGSAWFRDPTDPTAVQAPGSSTSQPCAGRDVLDLAVLSSTTARVLCADGLVRESTDKGSSWADSGQVSGAVALAVRSASPAQTYVARLGAPDCAGVQIERVDQSVGTSCIATELPKDPGQIALSLVSGGGWLAIGDTTMRSTDDLATWTVS